LAQFTSPANERVDSDILTYQVPGGMLSNFRNQLKEQGMSDKFDAVLKEIPIVREALGWIPLVTPTSQIVGTQAMMNVKFGRWKMICQPAQDIVLGKYGKTPGPIAPDVLAQVEKQSGKKPMKDRPADLLEPGMEKYRKQCADKGLPTDDETVVLFAMFPQQVEELIKGKPAGAAKTAAPVAKPPAKTPAPAPTAVTASGGGARHIFVTVEGTRHDVTVEQL
jgi:oxaloacetate decarboxylase alpha subunit/pyruvate carboxylase subunit B